MVTMEFEGSYDKEKNLSILRFIGTPKTKEDIEFIAEKARPIWEGDGVYKSWNITDISSLGKAPPGLVIYYNKLSKPFLKKFLHDYVVIAGTTLEKVAISLFNTFQGEKHIVVSNMEEALVKTEELQAREGLRPSKIESV